MVLALVRQQGIEDGHPGRRPVPLQRPHRVQELHVVLRDRPFGLPFFQQVAQAPAGGCGGVQQIRHRQIGVGIELGLQALQEPDRRALRFEGVVNQEDIGAARAELELDFELGAGEMPAADRPQVEPPVGVAERHLVGLEDVDDVGHPVPAQHVPRLDGVDRLEFGLLGPDDIVESLADLLA